MKVNRLMYAICDKCGLVIGWEGDLIPKKHANCQNMQKWYAVDEGILIVWDEVLR